MHIWDNFAEMHIILNIEIGIERNEANIVPFQVNNSHLWKIATVWILVVLWKQASENETEKNRKIYVLLYAYAGDKIQYNSVTT